MVSESFRPSIVNDFGMYLSFSWSELFLNLTLEYDNGWLFSLLFESSEDDEDESDNDCCCFADDDVSAGNNSWTDFSTFGELKLKFSSAWHGDNRLCDDGLEYTGCELTLKISWSFGEHEEWLNTNGFFVLVIKFDWMNFRGLQLPTGFSSCCSLEETVLVIVNNVWQVEFIELIIGFAILKADVEDTGAAEVVVMVLEVNVDVDNDVLVIWHDDFICFSYSSNCPKKLKFGDIDGRFFLIKL